jgi:hypothetical protein
LILERENGTCRESTGTQGLERAYIGREKEKGRVERWRGVVNTIRFHLPLIEPDVRICRIRLSEE